MALSSAPLLLLVLVAAVLPESCLGTSSHSLKYFSSSISEPNQGQPHFVTVGYVDGQVFVHYDSNSRRKQPRVSWMEKVGKEDPQYWDRETQISHGNEEVFKEDLETLRLRYNHSEEPKSIGYFMEFIVVYIVVFIVIIGILVFFKRRQDDYRAASKKNAGHLTAPLQHNFGLPSLQHKGEKKEESMGPFLS